jgi:hypothetical protein
MICSIKELKKEVYVLKAENKVEVKHNRVRNEHNTALNVFSKPCRNKKFIKIWYQQVFFGFANLVLTFWTFIAAWQGSQWTCRYP